MTSESTTRRELFEVEARAARLTAELRRVEGERDRLVLLLADNTGAESCRPVAVR